MSAIKDAEQALVRNWRPVVLYVGGTIALATLFHLDPA